MVSKETSKVPPPRSKMSTLHSRGFLVQAICDGCGGRLVNDTQDVQPSDGTSVLGCLTLGVVEVGRHSDDNILDVLADEGLGGLLHLDEHHGGYLLGGEGLLLTLVLDLDPGDVAIARFQREWPVLHVGLDNRVGVLAADEALGVEDGVVWAHRTLVLGGIADETLSVGEGDVARGGTVA